MGLPCIPDNEHTTSTIVYTHTLHILYYCYKHQMDYSFYSTSKVIPITKNNMIMSLTVNLIKCIV